MKNEKLYSIDSIELFECIENLKLELKKNNAEYKDLFEKIEKIKDKYSNIRGVLEDEKICEMTLEESKELLKAINLYRDLIRIEQYEIFLLGGGECFEYLKKIDVL